MMFSTPGGKIEINSAKRNVASGVKRRWLQHHRATDNKAGTISVPPSK
jgi:hypothetical protein